MKEKILNNPKTLLFWLFALLLSAILFLFFSLNDAHQVSSVQTVNQVEVANKADELDVSSLPPADIVLASAGDQDATVASIETPSTPPLQDVFASRVELGGDNLVLDEDGGALGNEKFSRAEWRRQLAQAKQVSETAETVISERQKQLDQVLAPNLDELKSVAKVEINYRIDQWRKAWSNGLVDQYLSFYSDNFVPSGEKTFSEWRDQRHALVSPDRGIFVELRNFDVVFDTSLKRATINLEQDYRAANFSEVSQKKIVLVKEGADWKIVLEEQLTP